MRDILLKNEKVAIPSREPGCAVRVAAVGCGTVGIADRRERTKLGKITDQVLAPIAAANGSDPH